MINFENMFNWLVKVSADEMLEPTELFDDCLDKKIGQFIHYFGQEFTDSFLGLSDNELTEIYPQDKCPLSADNRKKMEKILSVHILSCSACTQAELREHAINIVTDKAIRQHFKLVKETSAHPAVN